MLELMIFWGGGRGTRVSDFFTKNPNLKKKKILFFFVFFFFWEGGGGGGAGKGGVRWLD